MYIITQSCNNTLWAEDNTQCFPILSCLSYQPYPTLTYPTCPTYPILCPSQPHPSLPCPTVPCPTLLCNVPYPALSWTTLPYSALCYLTLHCPISKLFCKAISWYTLCMMLYSVIRRIFTSNVCTLVVPSHEGKSFQVHLAFPFATLKKIKVFSYFWRLETNALWTKLFRFSENIEQCYKLYVFGCLL